MTHVFTILTGFGLVGCTQPGDCSKDCRHDTSDTNRFDSGHDTDTDVDTDSDTDSDTDTDTDVDTDTEAPDGIAIDTVATSKVVGKEAYGAFFLQQRWIAGGDLNGDDSLDIVVGLSGSGSGAGFGAAYVMYGSLPSGVSSLADAAARFEGDEYDYAGSAVAFASDLTGDGSGDIAVGAPGGYEDYSCGGRIYVLEGPIVGEQTSNDAAAVLVGEVAGGYCSYSGYDLATGGDVTGDDIEDILIGAPYYNGGEGAAYVMAGPLSGQYDLADADARITAGQPDNLGGRVFAAGDVDGDGLGDVLVGAAGANYAVFFTGPVGGQLMPSDAQATFSGGALGSAGGNLASEDLDRDGYLDVIVSAPGDDEAAAGAGAVYVLPGSPVGDIDLSLAPTRLLGHSAWERAGTGLACPGDADGDGWADIVVGAPMNEGPGVAYIVFGPVSGVNSLSTVSVVLVGDGVDALGEILAPAGDFDGDGLDDLLLGAPGDADAGESAGAVWLVGGSALR